MGNDRLEKWLAKYEALQLRYEQLQNKYGEALDELKEARESIRLVQDENADFMGLANRLRSDLDAALKKKEYFAEMSKGLVDERDKLQADLDAAREESRLRRLDLSAAQEIIKNKEAERDKALSEVRGLNTEKYRLQCALDLATEGMTEEQLAPIKEFLTLTLIPKHH